MSSSVPVNPPPRAEHFPDDTARVRDLLAVGRSAEAVQHVMHAYRRGLVAYFVASSFRRRFPADESPESAVDDFFAERVGRPGVLDSYHGRESRFRYWLITAFRLHTSHRLRRERAEMKRREVLAARQPRPGRDEARCAFERELCRELVHQATEIASAACAAESRPEDWQTFLDHHVHGLGYLEIAAREGLTRRQVENRIRFALRRWRDALTGLLATRSTSGADVEEELRALAEALERCRT